MKWLRRVIGIVAAISLFTTTIFFATTTTRAGNPIVNGVYTYDPRNDQPKEIFIQTRPELALIDILNQYVNREGTYPVGTPSRLVAIEPTQVVVYINTSWRALAVVTTTLRYQDGTERKESFDFVSLNSQTLSIPLLPNIAFYNTFGHLSVCRKVTPTTSSCSIN